MKNILKNDYIFSLLSRFMNVGIGVLNSIFINRYLGPSLKGEYAYTLNIVNLAIIILNLGLYQSYPNNKRKNIDNILQKYFNIYMAQFFVYLLIGFILSFILKSITYTIILTLIPFGVLVKQLTFTCLIENIKIRNIIEVGNNVFYTLLLLIFYFFIPRHYLFIIGLLYIKDIFIILRIIYIFKLRLNLKQFDFSLLKKSIAFGIFPMLTMLLSKMNYKIDVIILKLYVPFEQIGLYSVGVSLANQVWLIPDAFKDVLFSKNAKKDSIEDILLSIKVNIYISFFTILFIMLFGKQILFILYGEEFVKSYMVTVLLFIGIIPMIFYKLIHTLFIANGKQKIPFTILLISVILNVIGNFIFIPFHGINGAAITSVGSYIICGSAFLYVFKKEFDIKWKDIFIFNKQEIKRIKIYSKKKKNHSA